MEIKCLYICHQNVSNLKIPGVPLLTWFSKDYGMNKQAHRLFGVEFNYSSVPNLNDDLNHR